MCSLLFFSLFFWFWSPTSPPFIGSGSSVGALQQRRLGNNKQDNPDSQIRQLRYLRTFFFSFKICPRCPPSGVRRSRGGAYVSKHCNLFFKLLFTFVVLKKNLLRSNTRSPRRRVTKEQFTFCRNKCKQNVMLHRSNC